MNKLVIQCFKISNFYNQGLHSTVAYLGSRKGEAKGAKVGKGGQA